MVIADVFLGALMEADINNIPIVTIECGGSKDPLADEIAFNGFELFVHLNDLFEPEQPPKVLHSPLRVELDESCNLSYGYEMHNGVDLLMPPDIDQLNFGRLSEGHGIGQVGPKGLSVLSARSANGTLSVEELFREEGGALLSTAPSTHS